MDAMWMNTYEVDEAVQRFAGHPILGPAALTLRNLRDCADSNSDGWAYWPKPKRAAEKLCALLESALGRQAEAAPAVTAEQVRAVYRPIKAFLTREKLAEKCQIVEPGHVPTPGETFTQSDMDEAMLVTGRVAYKRFPNDRDAALRYAAEVVGKLATGERLQ